MPDVFTVNCVAGVVFSAFGFIVFTYGKRMGYWTPMLCGLALMLLPLFVADVPCLSAARFWERRRLSSATPRSTKLGRNPANYHKHPSQHLHVAGATLKRQLV